MAGWEIDLKTRGHEAGRRDYPRLRREIVKIDTRLTLVCPDRPSQGRSMMESCNFPIATSALHLCFGMIDFGSECDVKVITGVKSESVHHEY